MILSELYLENVCRPNVSVNWRRHTSAGDSWHWTGWWRRKLSGHNPEGSPATTTENICCGSTDQRVIPSLSFLYKRLFRYKKQGTTLLTSTLSPSFSLTGSISHVLTNLQIWEKYSQTISVCFYDVHNHQDCVCLTFPFCSYLIYYRLQGNSQVTLPHNLHHVINASCRQWVPTEYSVCLPGLKKYIYVNETFPEHFFYMS